MSDPVLSSSSSSSCLLLFFFYWLSCCPPLGANLTDVEYTNLFMLNMFLLICACLREHAGEQGVCVCTYVCVWPLTGLRAACDHAYTECIYTLFVSLSHQYAAEVRAGCDGRAMPAQLSAAYLLVWLDNTFTHRRLHTHRRLLPVPL